LTPLVRFDLEHFVGFNSRFMIVSSCEDSTKSKLKIYDLEAIKNRESKDGALIEYIPSIRWQLMITESSARL
jgi:hypothetical protein